MEEIRQAIERVRATGASHAPRIVDAPSLLGPQSEEVVLDPSWLLSHRIVAHDRDAWEARPFDILRTQVLQAMDANGWKILGVTSPTPACGKTLTAVNLTLSMARQHDRQVALVDLDLRKPDVAKYLGLEAHRATVENVLEGQSVLRDAMVLARAGNPRFWVLPSRPSREASELIGSRGMQDLLQSLRRDCAVVIVDLPPVLSSDDVMCMMPHLDCFVLVTSVGRTKNSEVEESIRQVDGAKLVRLVLNKDPTARPNYYYY
jgi:protein-tyrosine kinase